jgi:hypothetical protein
MPRINDTDIYSIVPAISGTTLIGSLPTGETVQIDINATVDAKLAALDFISAHAATRVGQYIVGNDPDNANQTINNNINSGKKYFGIIKTFPFTQNSHIGFIYRLI